MMNEDKNNIKRLDQSAIASEAASWLSQLDSDAMNNADRLALKEWAARSPRHIAELRRLGKMWFDIDAVLQADVNQFEIKPSIGRTVVSAFQIRPKLTSGLTAMTATILFAAVFMLSSKPPIESINVTPVQVAYKVPAGQNKLVSLQDGSIIHANTDTLFEVDYNEQQRIIRLLKGEAHFDVAHDEERPFLVYAGGNIVRAVGTSFVIKIDLDATHVIVTEGKVELKSIRGTQTVEKKDSQATAIVNPNIESAFLSAGESAIVAPDAIDLVAEVKPISKVLIEKNLAWREGFIIFENEPLSNVVDEISRYTDAKIIISDPNIRDIPIGGVFPAGQVDALLGALETSFGVKKEVVSDDVIYLKGLSAK